MNINIKNIIVKLCLVLLFANTCYSQRAKNVIYFIGDGMGLAHTSLVGYISAANNDTIAYSSLTMDKLPIYGMATTHSKTRFITCSAAAGTALATGHKTHVDGIAFDSISGESFESIASKVKRAGEKVGIITSVFMNDATPAAFYAHSSNRRSYDDIAHQLISSNFDFFGGGGIITEKKSKLNVKKELSNAGYKIVTNNEELMNLGNNGDKVYFFADNLTKSMTMPYRIDDSSSISLGNITQKAISLLDNPNGFLLVVEGGLIDWAAHNNDAGAIVSEIRDFDNAIKVALEFYLKHPDETLIVVTSDHETGGLGLGFKGTKYESNYDVIINQKHSYPEMEKIVEQHFKNINTKLKQSESATLLFEQLGFSPDLLTNKQKDKLSNTYSKQYSIVENKSYKDIKYSYFTNDYIKLFNNFAGLEFTSDKHSSSPVPVRAIGIGSQMFSGLIDNTDIPKNIIKAKELK